MWTKKKDYRLYFNKNHDTATPLVFLKQNKWWFLEGVYNHCLNNNIDYALNRR